MRKAIGYLAILVSFFLSGFFQPLFAADFAPEFCPGSTTVLKTAIGCIDTSPGGLIQKILMLSIGIAGGIAFLMILLGGLQIQASAGNPEAVNNGREIIEGAIVGLLLIIFSVFILRLIGVDLLGIPGFR